VKVKHRQAEHIQNCLAIPTLEISKERERDRYILERIEIFTHLQEAFEEELDHLEVPEPARRKGRNSKE